MNSHDELMYRVLLHDELEDIRALMLAECRNIPQPAQAPVQRLITSGGKRLRPALVLLFAHMCQADSVKTTATAAAVEMLHTATLIHDDLIDGALMRRSVKTLNAQWSPTATVLAGDIIFSLAAKLIARSENLTLTRRFAETLEIICSGELSQMFDRSSEMPTVEEYYHRIYAKTASLFALSAESGPIIAECPTIIIERAQRIGTLLGEAFQIADDVLDLMGDPAVLGKPVGEDLRQGIITLPILEYTQVQPNAEELQAVLQRNANEETLGRFIRAIRASHAADAAMARARAHAKEALELVQEFPDTPYRRAVEEIIQFAVKRRY